MTQIDAYTFAFPFPTFNSEDLKRNIRRTSSAGDIPKSWTPGYLVDRPDNIASSRRGSASTNLTASTNASTTDITPATTAVVSGNLSSAGVTLDRDDTLRGGTIGSFIPAAEINHSFKFPSVGCTAETSVPQSEAPHFAGATVQADIQQEATLDPIPQVDQTQLPPGSPAVTAPIKIPAPKQPLRSALRRQSSPPTPQVPKTGTKLATQSLGHLHNDQTSSYSTLDHKVLDNAALSSKSHSTRSSVDPLENNKRHSGQAASSHSSNSFASYFNFRLMLSGARGNTDSNHEVAAGHRKGSDGQLQVHPRVSFSDNPEVLQPRRSSTGTFERSKSSPFNAGEREHSNGAGKAFPESIQPPGPQDSTSYHAGSGRGSTDGLAHHEERRGRSISRPSAPSASSERLHSVGRKQGKSFDVYTTTTTTRISNLSIFKPRPGEALSDAVPITVISERPASRGGVRDREHERQLSAPEETRIHVDGVMPAAEAEAYDEHYEGPPPTSPRKASGSIKNRRLYITPDIDGLDPYLSQQTIAAALWKPVRHSIGFDPSRSGSVVSSGARSRRSNNHDPTFRRSPWFRVVRLPPRWMSLRNAMALTNVLIITAAIVIIAAVSFIFGRDNASTALVALSNIALKAITLTIGAVLGRAEHTNISVAATAKVLDFKPDSPNCPAFFWGKVRGTTRYEGDQVYYVDKKGAFCGAMSTVPGNLDFGSPVINGYGREEGFLLRLGGGAAPVNRQCYSLNTSAARECSDFALEACVDRVLKDTISVAPDPYDATKQPYYSQALVNSSASWTPVYDLGSGDGYGFTNVLPIYNGSRTTGTFVGLTAVDVHIRSLSHYLTLALGAFLQNLDPEQPLDLALGREDSRVKFSLVDIDTGIIIASTCPALSSSLPPSCNSNNVVTPPLYFDDTLEDICLGSLAKLVGSLSRLPTDTVIQSQTTAILSTPLHVWSESSLVVAARYYPRRGLNWAIIGLVPAEYFNLRLGQLYTLTIPLTAACVLVAAGLASFLVTRAIGKPLKRAAEKMMRIADLNFDEDPDDPDDADEDSVIEDDMSDNRRWSITSLRWGWPLRKNKVDDEESNNGTLSRRKSFFSTSQRLRPQSGLTSRRGSTSSHRKDKKAPFAMKEIQLLNNAMDAMTSGLKSFSKYVPLDVVALLVKMKREAVLGVDEMSLSIFFSDIANFTTIAESMSPQQLVHVMSEYLNEMSSIILESQGIVDKFIGDAVMAFWNAPLFLEEHAIIACEAALKSQERLKELRENWLQKGYPEIRARIGLNTGPALVGNLGSPSRLNYTCLGDTVNLASRLEGLNKRYNTSIIVSDAVRDQVHEYFVLRPLDYVAVKGKTVAKKCYELVDTLDACDPVVLRRVALYEKAFDLYCQADFEQAKALFEAYLVDVPWDVPAIMHLEECIRLEEEGVPHNWSPVVVLDEK
ncbi:hypothetical protein HDU85_005548 [Gaertneriomyces sp. JEL0708]|nr:hypothetical protein HDU85_005548 [Gaertneriomyces sp. JEL0708]